MIVFNFPNIQTSFSTYVRLPLSCFSQLHISQLLNTHNRYPSESVKSVCKVDTNGHPNVRMYRRPAPPFRGFAETDFPELSSLDSARVFLWSQVLLLYLVGTLFPLLKPLTGTNQQGINYYSIH